MACPIIILCYKNIQNIMHHNICSLSLISIKVDSINYQILRPPVVTSQIRLYNNFVHGDPNKETGNLYEFKRQNLANYKFVSIKLQKLFGIQVVQIKEIMKICPNLRQCSSNTIENNYNLCRANDLTNETLLKYPQILTLNDIEVKINHLKQLPIDLNFTAPMLLSNASKLKKIVIDSEAEKLTVPSGNRILYMSKMLNLPVWEICEKLVHHSYIMRLPIERLDKILKILLDYGVEPRNILNDCWALRYNPQMAEERLQRAIKANVHKVKTWMIRCQDKVFERCINRQIENRKILGSHSSVEEYLSKRLDCSIENATYLTDKYPAILKMNILKMNKIMDFLFEKGYKPAHICRVPRILIHSLETTRSRLQQLKQCGYVPPSLAVLCKSKKEFDKILKKIIKVSKENNNTKCESQQT